MTNEPTLYEAAGGMPFFEALVARFYPEADLAAAQHRLTLFLAQYWGGPSTYDDERGHPRLRMRHAPFAIGPRERDAWLARMREAIAWSDPPPGVAERLNRYFDMAAEAMRNRD
jgi:hemoglobin